jgi:tetratricopeptide (TPR) repeat protein
MAGGVMEGRVAACSSDVPLAVLARHFLHAATLDARRTGARYALEAGRQSLDQLAYEEAADQFRQGISILTPRETDTSLYGELLLAFADAQTRAGDTTLARDTYLKAAVAARRSRSAQTLARAALGFGAVFDFNEVNRQLVDLLEESLGTLSMSDVALRSKVMSRLALALYWQPLGRWGCAQSRKLMLCDRARDLADSVGDECVRGEVLHNTYFATWGPENLRQRVSSAQEIVAIARKVGDPRLELQGLMWKIVNCSEVGDFHAYDAEVESYERLAKTLQEPLFTWRAMLWRSALALMRGRMDGIEEVLSNAHRLAVQADESTLRQSITAQLFFLRLEQGRPADLATELPGFVERFPEMPVWRVGALRVLVALGDLDRARHEFRELSGHGFKDFPRDSLWLSSMALLAETCAAVGDAPGARGLYTALKPFGDRYVTVGAAAALMGSTQRYLAILARVSGDRAAAQEHFRQAIARNAHAGAVLQLRHARREAAAMPGPLAERR